MQPNYGYYGEQKKKFPFRVVGLIAGVLILLVIAIIVIVSLQNRNSIGTQSQHLSVRLANLTTLTTAAAQELTSADLKKINAEADIINDGTLANLSTTLPKKVDTSVQSDESDASDTTKLANAKLAGAYDTAYKEVLQEKLESITALLTEMYTKTKSNSLRANLDDDYKNYEAILTNLNKITL